jgi:membrane protein implicated in regulation of membrane protease activity
MKPLEAPELREDGIERPSAKLDLGECEIDVVDGRYVARVGDQVYPAEGNDDYNVSSPVLVTGEDGRKVVVFPFTF